MRASSLSNPRVINLLNRYFIPVNVDGTFLKESPGSPAAEKVALAGVFQGFHQLNKQSRDSGNPELSIGTVHLYVLTPEGKPLDSMHVARAKPETVVAMLEKAIRTLNSPEGKPLIAPAAQAPRPEAGPDTLVLHLVARYLVPRNQPNARSDIKDDFVPLQPALGEERSDGWFGVPSEDWIVLEKEQWAKLLPAASVAVGESWEIDRETARELLVRFYPTTENNELSTNRIDRLSLKATLMSRDKTAYRARIDGELRMKHAFYPNRDDDNFVEAKVAGFIDFDPAGSRVPTLRLIADPARYSTRPDRFGAALDSVPAAPPE
jgi:hypothetical protein